MNILQFIIGLFTGQAGGAVGGAVSAVGQFAAVIAALSAFGLWLTKNKDEVFIALTYGDLAFWGLLACLLLSFIRLVHRAQPPGGQ